MGALEAAGLGDRIGHTSAMKGLLMGLVVGLVVTAVVLVAVGATVATGGAAAVVIGALIAGTAGGGLAGMKIGATIESDPMGPIATGSPDTFLGMDARPAARAIKDTVLCASHNVKPIAQGSIDVFINKAPAARRTDGTVCSGKIREGQPNVFFGGPTGTYLAMESEVPGWLVTTLEVAMWVGVGIATLGAAFTVGIGAALGGLAGGLIGGWAGGKIGGAIGGLFGERGRVIGEVMGSFVGSLAGGVVGAKGGEVVEGVIRAPAVTDPIATAPTTPDALANLTPAERVGYDNWRTTAETGAIEESPKAFWADKDVGLPAAQKFAADNPGVDVLENSQFGKDMVSTYENGGLKQAVSDGRLPWSGDGGVREVFDIGSARYAEGTVDTAHAFAENAGEQSIFRTTELPTLLGNQKVNTINFYDNAGNLTTTWTRTGPSSWSGGTAPGKVQPFDLSDYGY